MVVSVYACFCGAGDNLPLPLFIKCDDAEYGLRNIRHITALNGVGLWHKGFAA